MALPLVLCAADSTEFFETRVRPVLAKNCYPCHTTSRLGGLQLDSRDAMLKGGSSGQPAVVPGDPDRSLLIQAVNQTHDRVKMPPSGKLSGEQIQDLSAWVKGGAVWPEARKHRKGMLQITARPEQLPFADESADGVFAAGMPRAGVPALVEFARLVRDGGLVGVATASAGLGRKVLSPEVLAAAFLHAALADIEQRAVGSTLVTTGRVRRWDRAGRNQGVAGAGDAAEGGGAGDGGGSAPSLAGSAPGAVQKR